MSQQHSADSAKTAQPQVEARKIRTSPAKEFQGALHPIHQLQRTQGNRFVAQLIRARQAISGAKSLPETGELHTKKLLREDSPALEQESNELGARAAHEGNTPWLATRLGSGASNFAAINTNPASPGIVQRQTKEEHTYVPYQVQVLQQMTQAEFRAAAMHQIFGVVLDKIEWRNSKDTYVPEHSPYTVQVSIQLLRHVRGQASRQRGMHVEQDGGVTGAEERAKTFHAGLESDEKSALTQEIDRRYFASIGDLSGSKKIKAGEKGKAELWRMIRDEVLFQHEYIANLPSQVKELIKFSTKGKDLAPADYDKLFAIAKKIEKMPPGQVGDYAGKVRSTTTDLDVFEASLDKYIAEMAARARQSEERDKIQTKLIGLEEVYQKYRNYKSMLTTGSIAPGVGIGMAHAAGKVRQELETELQAHGFGGITEFKMFIKKFEEGFEQEAANIAKDLLAMYGGKLSREAERYKDQTEVALLYGKLGGVRTQFRELETNAQIWNDYVKASEQSRISGQGHLRPKTTFSEAEAARKKAEAAKASAQAQVQGMASDHPIFQEEGLPLDKRIDKAALAKASERELGELLQGYTSNRLKDIDEARTEIEGKPALIYKMDKLMPQFYAQQGIKQGSIHDMIIQDKMREDAILKLVKGIALAIVAVALAVVTFGAATPAIVAAGAAVAGAGLGGYMALEEYQEYTQQKNLADVGLSDDPSMVWVILAVVGAGLDMAAAVKAVKALAPAAKLLNAGGDLAEFTKAVRALEKANKIEAKIARAAEKAGAARKGFDAATGELAKTMAGKLYGFPGPLVDPEVYKAVVKMARQAIKTKVYDAQKFIEEIKLARVKAGLGDLAPEELAKAKQAWEEAKALETAELARYEKLLQQIPDATKLDALIASAGDVEKLDRLLKMFPVAELETIFAKLADSRRLVIMLDHVGSIETGPSLIREWMAAGEFAKMNQFIERLAGGLGKELAEKTALSGKSFIIDSNTAIALIKDANPTLRGTMHAGETARVAYIKSLPAGTELRVGNVTVGEIQGGVLNVKGMPIEVARESAEYQKVLGALSGQKVGGAQRFADRGLIADAFFAKTEAGVVPRFVTADRPVVKKLAGMATPKIDVNAIGGYPGLLKQYGTSGFNIIIESRTLTIIPVP